MSCVSSRLVEKVRKLEELACGKAPQGRALLLRGQTMTPKNSRRWWAYPICRVRAEIATQVHYVLD